MNTVAPGTVAGTGFACGAGAGGARAAAGGAPFELLGRGDADGAYGALERAVKTCTRKNVSLKSTHEKKDPHK